MCRSCSALLCSGVFVDMVISCQDNQGKASQQQKDGAAAARKELSNVEKQLAAKEHKLDQLRNLRHSVSNTSASE